MRAVLSTTLSALGLALVAAGPPVTASVGDPEPRTPEWHLRDAENVARMTGRTRDQVTNPDYGARTGLHGLALFAEGLADQALHPDRPSVTLAQLVPGGRAADAYRRDWEQRGRGVMVPFDYHNRYGPRI